MEALKRIKQAFDTTNHWQAEVQRVEQTKQIERTQPVPRVTFEEVSPPSRLVVGSSNDPVVVSPEKQIVMPKPSTPTQSHSKHHPGANNRSRKQSQPNQ
jgi:hypothetical protein